MRKYLSHRRNVKIKCSNIHVSIVPGTWQYSREKEDEKEREKEKNLNQLL